ncbi:MAG: hypothetical protein AAF800_01255 [Planctomycetota bacterium]
MTRSDDANPTSTPARPRRRRAWLVLLPLCVAAAWAGWSIASRLADVPADVAPVSAGTLRYDETPGVRGGADLMRGLLAAPRDADGLRLNPAHRPLEREPAGLPPVPGAEHHSRYRLSDGGLTDEVSYWWVDPADAGSVAGHYHDAVTRRGWVAAGPAGGSTRVYLDPDGSGSVLTVRVAERRGRHHVTLWLRYETDKSQETKTP